MDNYFDSPFTLMPTSEQIINPNIITGVYSYYAGYYHGHSFDDFAHFLSFVRRGVVRQFMEMYGFLFEGSP